MKKPEEEKVKKPPKSKQQRTVMDKMVRTSDYEEK